MTLVERCLEQRKLLLTLVVLLALLGIFSWRTMTRQEDPRLPDYYGQVDVYFPGADAETVERLVLEPIEEQLAQVEEVWKIHSTANAELVVMGIDLHEGLRDTDAAWDRVRQALAEARREFPEGAGEPFLDDRVIDTDSVVYALTGSSDPLVLAAAAERLKEEMLRVPGVAEADLIADPGEQITVELDDAVLRRLGLEPAGVARQLAARSGILPGGSLRLGRQSVRLRPQTDFESLDEIRATPIDVGDGAALPLAAIGRVRYGPEEPTRFRARHNGAAMVGLGLVPQRHINLVAFGERVRAAAAAFAPSLAPIEVHEVAFQADRVAARLGNLARSLFLGAAIVAGVLIAVMGLRLGLVVTAVVPLVTLSSIALFNLGGGVLHQISIAALVIALGMLVDNGIVVTEAIQWSIDRGEEHAVAARRAVRELAAPLAAATATTLAAFVPMLLSKSSTGDFTRAIPVVIMLTLTVSYVFAMFVTPILGQLFLRRRKVGAGDRFARLAGRVGHLAVTRPGMVLLLAAVVVGGSLMAAGWVGQEFFPGSDRNQFVVEVRLPEGTHLDATDRVARRLERSLAERPEVVAVTTFVGRSAPRFYYNVDQVPWSPHFGHLLVQTRTTTDVDPAVAWARRHARAEVLEAEVVVRKLEQGPPVEAPVEILLYGESPAELAVAVEAVVGELRDVPGAADVRNTLSIGAPTLRLHVDDAAAARRGLSRADVAATLFRNTRGLVVGQYRAGDDPVPVRLRTAAGEELPVDNLAAVDVSGAGSGPVPLGEVARIEVEWRPGAIEHYDRRRYAAVLSQLDDGYTYSDVMRAIEPRLAALELPPGVELAYAGAAEESDAANAAIVRMVPVGLILLLSILLAEFRSFRRLGIVLVTVPLAAAGVVPGLLLSGQPFGFMSMLGVVALVGVVVNNAIVLLEVIESSRREGADVPTAVRRAVERRMRPILLTTLTTVAGLLPLALSSSSLWPPMAWALISGLTASTLLTLLVVPSLYLLLISPRDFWGRGRLATAASALLVALVPAAAGAAGTPVDAEPRGGEAATPSGVTLAEALQLGAARPRVGAARERAGAAFERAVAGTRASSWPTLVAGAAISERDRALDLVTPIGAFAFQPSRDESAAVTLLQPLLRPASRFYASPASRARAEGLEAQAERAARVSAAQAAEALLDVAALDAAIAATESQLASLEADLTDTEARVEAGRTLASDALKVRLARDGAAQSLLALGEGRRVAVRELGRALGAGRAVEPILGPECVVASGDVASGLARALEQRADLTALAAAVRAAELGRRAVRAERWPDLDAVATWTYTTGSPFAQEEWVEGSLRLSWTPFSPSRKPRSRALAAERRALESEQREALAGVAVEIEAALAEIATTRAALRLGESAVAQAEETLRVERERYRAGRVTTNDLLEAQAAVRRETTRRDLARLDLVRSGVRFDLATGDPFQAARCDG